MAGGAPHSGVVWTGLVYYRMAWTRVGDHLQSLEGPLDLVLSVGAGYQGVRRAYFPFRRCLGLWGLVTFLKLVTGGVGDA